MKIITNLLVALTLSAAATASPVTLLVDFKDDATRTDIAETADDIGADLTPNSVVSSKTKIMKVTVDSERVSDLIDDLSSDGDIEHVEVSQIYRAFANGADFDVPNDPAYAKQMWHFDMIKLPVAWRSATGKGVKVAVVDTGISGPKSKYPQIPDLKNTCFVPGYDFVADTDDPYDVQSHGTHVGSTIAESTNNSVGGVGIAFNACLMPVKVLSDEGYGQTADIAEGIRWAVDNGAQVLNMSLGGGGASKIIGDALLYAVEHNAIVFCAAGNSGRGQVEYPAGQDGCVAVSAVGPDGKLAPYSSHGRDATDRNGVFIAAPGGNTRDFGPEGGVWQSTVNPENWKEWGMFPYQGTSMATPMASGVAALVISRLGENYSRDEVLEIMASTAVDKGDEFRYGAGILDAGAAVAAAVSSDGPSGMVVAIVLFALVAIVVAGKRLFG